MNGGLKVEENIRENKMGIVPVNKLLLSMGVPMIMSMILQAFYNIVDSYFVSRMPDTATITGMGEYAVNALTLAFPIQMLIVGVGVGTGVGINALLSKVLGEGNREKAAHIAGNAVFLGICTYIAFLIFTIFGMNAYLVSQTTDEIVLGLSKTYLSICTVMSFGCIFSMIYEKMLQSTGRTIFPTIGQAAGAIANIVLDPVLIFGLGPFPQMGIAGAAYATIIGQMITFVLNAYFHFKYNHDIKNSIKYLKPSSSIIKQIYVVGIPAIIMQALISFMSYGVNVIFGAVSTSAVTAYGVYYKIQQFIYLAGIGMNNAVIPVVGFNYGRHDKARINQAIHYGMIYTLIIMLIGLIGLQIFAEPLAGVFSLSDETLALCVRAIRIVTLGYLFIGANVIYQGVFQALGCGFHSLIVSAIRQIIVALPLCWIFTKLPNAESMMWVAFPVAEGIALVAAITFMRKIKQNRLNWTEKTVNNIDFVSTVTNI